MEALIRRGAVPAAVRGRRASGMGRLHRAALSTHGGALLVSSASTGKGRGQEATFPRPSSDGQRYHFKLVSKALICPAPNMAVWGKKKILSSI